MGNLRSVYRHFMRGKPFLIPSFVGENNEHRRYLLSELVSKFRMDSFKQTNKKKTSCLIREEVSAFESLPLTHSANLQRLQTLFSRRLQTSERKVIGS
ncbi:Protein Themis2 [Manis pentadactyla]|nr:Protein Themis2 [Manis pentadactyla]